MAPGSRAGIQSFTSKNGQWRVSTRKQPILKADPIEELSKKIGIPIPEMIFGDNFVCVEHVPTGWTLDFMRRRSAGGFRPVMEFLIASAAQDLRAAGDEVLSLSGAPLARLDRGSAGEGGEIAKRLAVVGHQAPTLFLRFIAATSRVSGAWPPCGWSVPL